MIITLVLIYFCTSFRLGHTVKTDCIRFQIVDPGSRDMVNFDFLEKSPGLVPPSHFAYRFSRKIGLMFTLLTDRISMFDCVYF